MDLCKLLKSYVVGSFVNLKLEASLPECENYWEQVCAKNDQFSMHACKVTSTCRGQYYSNKQQR